jgi:16S rRNA (uracil1498-N3)-methyltransferase
MPAPRLLIGADLAENAAIPLDVEQAAYLGRVLRLAPGDRVRVFNGRDGEWLARIAEIGKRGGALTLEARTRAQALPPDLELWFAPVKRQATDWIVEKATELGVRALQPVLTRRTVAETVRLDRLAAIAREAAEQAERLEAPDIRPTLTFAQALDGWDETRGLVFADEAGDEGRAAPLVAADLARFSRLAVLIGPEGGFDPAERRLLRVKSFVIPASLGPRILRAETAVCAALSLVQALWGDWR